MKIKYAIARLERKGNQMLHYPVLEFDDYSEAVRNLSKVKSNQYAILPMVLE